jgi:hypothetical protein
MGVINHNRFRDMNAKTYREEVTVSLTLSGCLVDGTWAVSFVASGNNHRNIYADIPTLGEALELAAYLTEKKFKHVGEIVGARAARDAARAERERGRQATFQEAP